MPLQSFGPPSTSERHGRSGWLPPICGRELGAVAGCRRRIGPCLRGLPRGFSQRKRHPTSQQWCVDEEDDVDVFEGRSSCRMCV